MHLIINLYFSFQFINLSNLALWVNNMHKWITGIFLNLCDNFLYYMICFFLLSLVFVFIYLFVFVFVLSPYFWHSRTHPIPLPILWFYCTSSKKIFLTLHFFFLSLILVIAQPPVDKEQIVKHYTNIFSNLKSLQTLLSLSLSLIYII